MVLGTVSVTPAGRLAQFQDGLRVRMTQEQAASAASALQIGREKDGKLPRTLTFWGREFAAPAPGGLVWEPAAPAPGEEAVEESIWGDT